MKTRLLLILDVVLLALAILVVSTEAECSESVLGTMEDFYILSDEEANANEAQEKCLSSGGRMAPVHHQDTKKLLWKFMNDRYTKDLQEVRIYIHSNRDTVKYYTSKAQEEDFTDQPEWMRPKKGELSSFKMFTRPTRGFVTPVSFCWFKDRDLINGSCTEGWKDNFELFGGNVTTNKTTKLYNFYRDVIHHGCSKLLLSDATTPDYYSRFEPTPVLYILDIRVFIGARSDVYDADWTWSDDVRVTDADYPISSKSICEQMAWTLVYDDKVNLSPKRCDSGLAYYVCQFKLMTSLESLNRNSSYLKLKWNASFNFHAITSSVPKLFVTVKVVNTNFRLEDIPFNQSEILIPNLQQRTWYTVKIRVKESDCIASNRFVTSKASFTTSYGIPDVIVSAQVGNLTSESAYCVIVWNHNTSDDDLLSYKITATSNQNVTITNIDCPTTNDSNHGEQLRQVLDLSGHGERNLVRFQIQVRSCEGESEPKIVTGQCMSSGNPNYLIQESERNVWIWIGISSIGLLLVVMGWNIVSKRYNLSISKCMGRRR